MNLTKEKRIFNYRLSRARRVVENAFGILANRFRVFLNTINLAPEKVTHLVLAACCLHNFIVEKNKSTYTSAMGVDADEGWGSNTTLVGMSPSVGRNSTTGAKSQRDKLAAYFCSECGSVPWQDYMTE